MGYTERPEGIPNHTKALWSMWVYIDAATISAVNGLEDPAETESDSFEGYCYHPPLHKVIPIITFGSLETTYADSNVGEALPVNPSFIGVDCFNDPRVLCVNLQMSNPAVWDLGEDGSMERPSCFYMSGDGGPGNRLEFTGDQWHHILIWYDLGTSCSMDHISDSDPETPAVVYSGTGPRFRWVFDDVVRNGEAGFPSGSPEGEEDELTTFHIYPSSISPSSGPAPPLDGVSTATWTTTDLLTEGNTIGVPSTGDFVSNIFNIKITELQVYTNVDADITTETVRRYFITAEGRPERQSVAAAGLGQDPDVYFRRHTDWQSGNNSGTEGDFDPTGTILQYVPGP